MVASYGGPLFGQKGSFMMGLGARKAKKGSDSNRDLSQKTLISIQHPGVIRIRGAYSLSGLQEEAMLRFIRGMFEASSIRSLEIPAARNSATVLFDPKQHTAKAVLIGLAESPKSKKIWNRALEKPSRCHLFASPRTCLGIFITIATAIW